MFSWRPASAHGGKCRGPAPTSSVEPAQWRIALLDDYSEAGGLSSVTAGLLRGLLPSRESRRQPKAD